MSKRKGMSMALSASSVPVATKRNELLDWSRLERAGEGRVARFTMRHVTNINVWIDLFMRTQGSATTGLITQTSFICPIHARIETIRHERSPSSLFAKSLWAKWIQKTLSSRDRKGGRRAEAGYQVRPRKQSQSLH